MNKSFKINIFIITFILSLIIIIPVISACDNTSISSNTPAPSVTPPSSSPYQPPTPDPADSPSVSVNRVDIVYFHPKIRCGACISVELRTKAVLDSYFKDAMDSGKLTFKTYELQDKQNASIVKKYGAMSSQLFITTVKNGVENIKHVEEVWMPQILNDGVAFDEFMQKLIRQKLEEVA